VQLSYEIVTAPASAIRAGGAHLFWAGEPSPALVESLDRTGQVQPVLAHETPDGLVLVAGHARLAALRSLGAPVLVRLVIDPAPVDLGIIYMADNALRPLDDAMRLAALRYFRPLLDDARLAHDVLPGLNLNPGSKDARLLADWLALPDHWQTHLAAGRVPLAAGTVLGRMTDADRLAVAPLFAGLSWSRSNAVNLLTWLFEAAKMNGTTVARIMADAGMTDFAAEALSPKDAMARLVAMARDARHPTLRALQSRFDASARELAASTGWRVLQPDNFETGSVELSIRVADPAQLDRAVRGLQTMADRPQWHHLWTTGDTND
jgi:ParB family chromosome partitioning protein